MLRLLLPDTNWYGLDDYEQSDLKEFVGKCILLLPLML